MRWKLWYGDRSTYDSTQGDWQSAPAWNAQVLGTEDDYVGRELDGGKYFLLWWPGATEPWGVDAVGLYDYLRHIQHPEANKPLSMVDFTRLVAVGVKFGRSLDNHVYRAIMAAASLDTFLPQKTGTLSHERRDG